MMQISPVKGVLTINETREIPSFSWVRTTSSVIDSLSVFAGSLAGYAILFAALAIVYDVIMRWLFHNPTIWVVDITGYILVWFGFISAAYGLKEGSHISVDILVSRLGSRAKVSLEVITYALCFIYTLIMLVYSWKMTVKSFIREETAPTILQMPVYLIELGIVVGSFLLCLQALRQLGEKVSVLARGNLTTRGFLDSPVIILPFFSVLALLGLCLYTTNPGVGIIFTLLVLLLAGVPVFASLGLVGITGLYILMGAKTGLPQTAFIGLKSLDNFVLLAIPLYILAGQILVSGGIGKELYDVCVKWIGHLPGGIAAATVGACAIFAAISGSSVATAVTIALIALPEMQKYNYDPRLAYGVLAAGGTLGILIPPSNSMIIFSSITDESTGALFMGGVVPGILMALIFAVFAMLTCARTGQYEKLKPAPWSERFLIIKSSFWGLLTPVIIIAVIYTGICTPSEAAAIAVLYALVVSLLRRATNLKDLNAIMIDSTKNGTMILMIVVGAMILGTIVTFLQIPQHVVSFVGSLQIPVWLVMSLLCIVFIILGMFLEVVSIMLITMPIVYPLIINLGINGLWFGVWITLLMEMALITPPVGLNIYVIQGVSGDSMTRVIRGVFPFMIILLGSLLLLALLPQLILWLPGTMGFEMGR